MTRLNCEPTIDEILREPMVRALMRADRVDAPSFEAKLRGMAAPVARIGKRFAEPSRFPLAGAAANAAEQACACR